MSNKIIKKVMNKCDLGNQNVEAETISLAQENYGHFSNEQTLDVVFGNSGDFSQSSFQTGVQRKSYKVNYRLNEQIGEGGMAVVFKGWQKTLQRSVAIKSNKRDSLTEKHKFVAEATITALLDHPNIVPVYDLYRDDEQLFMSMKLVEGVTWKELLYKRKTEESRKEQDQSEKRHIQILISVCNAIAFAHDKKIVHNDLKPENIIIGKFGEVLVMDWGLGVDISENPRYMCLHRNDITGAMGTPSYMAPELLSGYGKNIGPWTDVYLLGGILYEILCGSPPHKGKTLENTLLQCLQGSIPKLPGHVHSSIANICYKALSLKPQDRYQSVKDLREELDRFLGHKESITISTSAYNGLEKIAGERKDIPDHEQHEKFQEIIFSFQQSLLLWNENNLATQGLKKARFEYAKLALQNKEFALAKSQIDKIIPSVPKVQALKKEIIAAEKKHLNSQNIMKRLYYGVYALIITVIIVLTGTTLVVQNEHKRTALQTAKIFVQSLNQVRSKYSKEVVSKITSIHSDIKLSHDPKSIKEIPFPATFTIGLAEEMNNISSQEGLYVKLYSRYPFPWREKSRGNSLDQFQKEVFQSLATNPEKKSFTKMEKINGRSYLRYAEAVSLKASCIHCHNTHPQSPKRDWKEGDVRGIQEVSVPVETVMESIQKLWK